MPASHAPHIAAAPSSCSPRAALPLTSLRIATTPIGEPSGTPRFRSERSNPVSRWRPPNRPSA
jgi:hypothetical protein